MAKIYAIGKADLEKMSGAVTHSITLNRDESVESPSIFGNVEGKKDKEFENVDIYYKKGYIKLCIPVLNFFLAGNDANVMNVIFKGIANISEISQGQRIYDTEEKKDITTDKIDPKIEYKREQYLIGGDYIKYLIDNLDVEGEIVGILKGYAYSAISKCSYRLDKDVNIGDITKGSGQIWLVDEYYFNPKIPINETEFSKIYQKYIEAEFRVYLSRLLLLLSIRGDGIKKLRNQVQDYIVVLPYGFRPSFKNQKDKLTKAYDSVVRINNELGSRVYRCNASLSSVRTQYIELVKAVKHVTIKNMNRYDNQYRAIFEKMTGKKGLIRDKMQGVRVDYSGRSVIIVDPEMSVDTIGVPISMAERLMELRLLKEYKTKCKNKYEYLGDSKALERKEMTKKLLEGDYAIIGRQPTLYRLGVGGFKVKIVDGSAIVLNPLICPAFNADFDGDQMHISIPVSEEAQRDVRELLASTNNLYLGRNGECHIAPRQELIYGLWKAFTIEIKRVSKDGSEIDENEPLNGSNTNLVCTVGDTKVQREAFVKKVCKQEYNIYDSVKYKGKFMSAGKAAIKCCLPTNYSQHRLGIKPITDDPDYVVRDKHGNEIDELPVTEKWFKLLLRDIALNNSNTKDDFVTTVNNLVRLGFAVAEIWPPALPVLNHPDTSQLIRDFDKKIEAREELYNRGFETTLAYTTFYDEAYKALEKEVTDAVTSTIDRASGYYQMSESGARGNKSNLRQLFGMKGRGMKNESESFNAIIKHPLVEQLTGLEHYLTAYGSRQGLIDKTIATYKPGYLSRKMQHTSSSISITNLDCGDTEGLTLDYDFLKQFVDPKTLAINEYQGWEDVMSLIVSILVDRSIVEDNVYITNKKIAREMAEKYVAEWDPVNNEVIVHEGIHLRSPLTCKNPCCAKCYGKYLGTNSRAVVGLPVGFEAATSIGEPGTQLTMKNFQSGGVVGNKNLTSSFDTLGEYLELTNQGGNKKKKNENNAITYDYISPVEGKISTSSKGNGTKRVYIMGPNADGEMKNRLRETVHVYSNVELKDYVKVGDSIQKYQGNMNLIEIMKYRSVPYAQKYLALMLYTIFQKEVEVNFKHFEVLISGMMFRVCTKGNDYFKTGHYYTNVEYYSHDRTGCKFFYELEGLKNVPKFRNDVFSAFFMEDIQRGIERAIIVSGKDEMKLPIVRYSFGLPLGIGSDIPEYIEERGRN